MTDKKYPHYTLLREVEIPEIRAKLTLLTHEKTGAKVMHLLTDDDENFFDLSFQTHPKTSNGIAHILEHTVLCGSKKFPVRDPFFSMSRRSLNTFMNAFTGADFTCYPAASQVKKDFYNLLEVYLDAVFHPLLSLPSFRQEGHRLEFVNEKLTIKGIVYNEMKGAMASPDSRLSEALMEALFPDLTYGINSGGDPKEIPHLTYEELLQFHREFYHPSRCLFFFYGNLPLSEHLEFIETHALADVSPVTPLAPLPKQPRFHTKVKKTLTYPISKEEDAKEKSMVSFGWLTTSILEQEELLALNVIDLVLMGTDAAPLKMALLKSNLCKQADSSLEDEISEVPFLLVCKGCKQDAADPLEKVIFDTLKKIASKPLSKDLVEGAIHQLELGRKEISAPYGLALYFRSALLMQHGGNPEDGLKIHTLFKKLREKVLDPTYLPGLIQKHFLNNQHVVRIVMHPDKELQKRELEEEEKRILEISKSLNKKEIERIRLESGELEKQQEKKESLDILPKLSLSDVSKTGKEFLLLNEKKGPFSLFYHPTFTNEILYADLSFDLPVLKEEEIPYLRLFTLFLSQVGCGGRDYKEHLDYLFEHTGGLGVDLDFSCLGQNPFQALPALSIRGKAVYSKVERLFPLFTDLLTSADFNDVERIQELLMQHFEEVEHSIQTSPLRYAMHLAVAGFSGPLKVRNQLYGIEYYDKLKAIVAEFEKDPKELIENLNSLKEKCLGLKDGHLILGGDETIIQTLEQKKYYGLERLPSKDFIPWRLEHSVSPITSQGRITSTPVVFTTLAFPSFPYVHPSSAPLSIASKLMENKTLHKRIREQGGAYGSGAANVPMSGYFYFYSYRDPHLTSTKAAFREAIEELMKGNFDENDLIDAKLGILQDLDSPLSPGHKAFTAYERLRSGRTPEKRQEYRQRLMGSTKEEMIELAKEVLLPGFEKGVLVSFGAEEILQEGKLPIYSR